MPDPEIWPPKPNLPDPLTQYDALITEQTIALPGEPPAFRMFNLLQVLRKEKGLDWLSGIGVVQSYYQRHGSPPDTKRQVALAFTALAFAFPACLLLLCDNYLMFHRDAVLSQPNHLAAVRLLDQERHLIELTVGLLLPLTWILLAVIFGPATYRKICKK